MPIDADLYFSEMNNARFMRELDFARLSFCERTGLRSSITRVINGTVLQSVNFIRYEKKIPLLSLYKISTKVIYKLLNRNYVIINISVVVISVNLLG